VYAYFGGSLGIVRCSWSHRRRPRVSAVHQRRMTPKAHTAPPRRSHGRPRRARVGPRHGLGGRTRPRDRRHGDRRRTGLPVPRPVIDLSSFNEEKFSRDNTRRRQAEYTHADKERSKGTSVQHISILGPQ